MAETIIWTGASGAQYEYRIYLFPHDFIVTPANYIFAKKTILGNFRAVYIGETGDLSDRFDNHRAMPCIQRQGATHIHAHATSDGAQTRRDEESDLIANYDPPCNDQ